MKVFVLIFVLVLSSLAFGKGCDDPKKCKKYQGIVIGGGFSGLGFTYYTDLIKRLANETGMKLSYNIDLSKVLLIEKREVLGGVTRAKILTDVDEPASKRAKAFYNLSGDWLIDLSTQRVPQVTAKADRSTAIDSQTIEEFTPYQTYEYSRGRHLRCPSPNFADYSPDNIYGISGSCSDDFSFVGDPLVNYTVLGPAYNVSNLQPWARLEDSISPLANHMLYGAPHPVLCPDPTIPCNECAGGCWVDNVGKYVTLQAALIGEFGHEPNSLWWQDFGGFYADPYKGTIDPTSWSENYLYREWSTTPINGYTVNSTLTYINNIAKPILKQGNVLLNTTVVSINSAGGGNSVQVTTDDGITYQADWVILATEPEQITSGKITGNIANKLNDTKIFHAPFCIRVITVTVGVEFPFWRQLLPVPNGSITEWALLRAFGEQGHLSRVEIRHTLAGAASLEFRAAYTDYIMQEMWDKFVGREELFKEQIWDLLKNDLAYAFELDRDQLPQEALTVKIENIDNGWCYYNGTNLADENDPLSRYNTSEIVEYAINPLPRVYMPHQAWKVEFLGWKEAALRGAQDVLSALVPEANFLLQCWMYKTFPECPSNVSCYSDPSVYILGTETLIPSRYCSEHWWMNDYAYTPNCVKKVHLSPMDIPMCKEAIMTYGKI